MRRKIKENMVDIHGPKLPNVDVDINALKYQED